MAPPTSQVVPNLVQGVSQQPAAIRNPAQAELVENAMGTVPFSQEMRNHTDWIGGLSASPHGYAPGVQSGAVYLESMTFKLSDDTYHHVESDGYDVWIDGTKIAHVIPGGGDGYLDGSPVKFMQLGDEILVLNTLKITSKTALAANLPVQAIVWVENTAAFASQVSPGIEFVIKVDTFTAVFADGVMSGGTAGVTYSSQDVTGSNGNVHGWATTLPAAMGGSAANYLLRSQGSYFFVERTSNSTPFTISVASTNDNWVKAIKGVTSDFTDLPVYAPDGFTCKIAGDNSNAFAAYWVKFTVTDGGAFGLGTWQETNDGGSEAVTASTMPHFIYKDHSTGFWTLSNAPDPFTGITPWPGRLVGDSVTNPGPSFIGHAIKDMVFFKNRLGFIFNQSLVLSAAGDYFNFYRDTVVAVTDADPIDIIISSAGEGVTFNHALVADLGIILFGEHGQWLVSSSGTFTNANIADVKISAYDCDPTTRPVIMNDKIYFLSPRGLGYGVYEYYPQSNTLNAAATRQASDITLHCPTYVNPQGIRRILACPKENVLLVIGGKDPARNACSIWVYKSYWDGGQKIQSNWSSWVFDDSYNTYAGSSPYAAIVSALVIQSVLYLFFQRNDAFVIETVSLAVGVVDSGAAYQVHLDRRVSTVGTGTTLTLPYIAYGAIKLITLAGVELVTSNQRVSGGATLIDTATNIAGVGVWAGQVYTMKHRVSQQYEKDSNGNAIEVGRLTYRYWYLSYENSGAIFVVVTPIAQYGKMTMDVARTYRNPPGTVSGLARGVLEFPVGMPSDRVRVEFQCSDWLGCRLIKFEWTGTFVNKTPRGQ